MWIQFRQTAVAVMVITLLATSAWADSDVQGSTDSTMIKRYPHSFIKQYADYHVDDHMLVTGSIEEVNGEWRAENMQRLSGHLARITYRIPDGHKPTMVLAFFEKQFQQLQAEVLFECQKRGCGNSNLWANWVFNVKELYGPDRNQSYRVYRLQQTGGDQYFALYIIERGNKRVYAHIDQLSEESQQVGDTFSSLQKGHKVVVPFQLNQRLEPALIAAIVKYLNQTPGSKLLLVGHSYGSESLPVLKSRSLAYARQLQDQLVVAGAEVDQLILDGIGPLAPLTAIEQGVERVELIPR